jgi:DNA-binding transcriptional LysR family regulator
MSLLGFAYFVTVAKEGNISRAAEKLYVSQQSLSAHIKRLEAQYGVTLFERKPVLRLTPAGKAMLFYAQQILQAEDQMTAQFTDLVKDYHGELRFGISRQRGEAFFTHIWERYHERYPHIEVLLKEQNSEELLNRLRTHQLDLCIGVNVPEDRDLQIEPLVEEHLCCSLSQSLLMHYRPATGQEDFQRYVREGVDLLELQDLPFFHRPQENQIRVAVDRLYASHSLYPHCILETNNQRLMLSLAQYGVGIITPIYLYICYETQSLALGLPQIVKLTNDIISTKISIVTLKDHPLPDYAEAMKVLIRDEFQRYKTVLDQLFPFSLVS